ncbi:membrane protein [Parapedobacter pyrenivorans]|uniref:Membrane protein n=1 Tax=Parapedobacter pyrenivorans TaxID=1305674 RepID=A0A917HI11_9SPHI|nr:RagB/SusD family nutrient uptake outer membrane protein [Parapedobacter pyrenivorans]GGG79558.1 membrane protein [Parapedobacter pyrenivorans]
MKLIAKQNIIRGFLAMLVATMILSSCQDNLSLDPISEISNSSFWKTEDDARGGMYGMYTRFRSEAQTKLFLWGEARSDVMERSLGGTNNYERYYLNSLDRNFAGPDWMGLYTVVHDANLLIKNVPNIPFADESDKQAILAQAHTMRAFVYFIMARTWGGVPLVTDPTEGYSPDMTQRVKAPVSEIFGLIKQDIDQALAYYPDNTFPTGRFFWSKPAALTLKGDVYLWTAKRQGGGDSDAEIAMAALNEARNADVTLLDDFSQVSAYGNKGNKEIVMAIRFQELETGNISAYQDMYMSSAFLSADMDEATRAAIGTLGGNPYWRISDEVRPQFSDADQRKAATYLDIFTNGGQDHYGAVQLKFKGTVIGGARQFIDDFVIYRYADILLLLAEAKNVLGMDPTEEMNAVRERAYGEQFASHVFVNADPEANDEAILQERLFEFALEGKRWWDLVRFGKAFELVPSLRDRADEQHLLLFPISETTLSLEPNVEQNDGYN